MEVAVRAYTTQVESKDKLRYEAEKELPDYKRFICFDTESRTNEQQAFTFGSYVVYNGDVLEQIGLFYDPEEITENELKTLRAYCASEQVVKLYTLSEFVEGVFYPLVYKQKIPCVGFNLPFDLSRLALGFGYARRHMKGGFTLKLSKEKKNAPIIIKEISRNEAFIRFQSSKGNKFQGYFIDCLRLASILSDYKRMSLAEACRRFNKKYQKLSASEHGRVDGSYVTYNIADTLATAELFGHLRAEFERYGIDLPLTAVYSQASIGKGVLQALGIKPFKEQNPDFPATLLGKIMQTYYGGRTESQIRAQPVRVGVLDFTSEYASLFTLLGLYDLLVAERIDYEDATESTIRLLNEITEGDLQNPETWKKFNVIVEIEPDDTLVPVRARYSEDGQAFTVGLNYLTSEKSLWYGLPSLILSRLLTNRVPKVKQAIRFIPIGRQKSLTKATILGMEIDPRKDNPLKVLVEEKQRSRVAKDGRDKAIKILISASGYGIFCELNREDANKEIMVYSGNEQFQDFKRPEKEGRFFNPIIAAMTSDGAKLLLGIGDLILKEHNDVMAYTDTDSMFMPSQYKDELVEWFDHLNPYSNVPNLLKVEEDDIWFYGISAKRYVLYDIGKDGNFVIKDDKGGENFSLHGLGHLLNPFNDRERHWQRQIWEDILSLYYSKITTEEFLNKYRPFYTISQFTVSTASLMRRFARLNKGKSYRDQIKPFNFLLLGFSNVKDVKPIAPFSWDSQSMPYGSFINYKTGETMHGQQYFKSLADELWSYYNHPEAKLEGNTGVLQRRHVTADKITLIGKEADRIEESLSGLSALDYNVYSNSAEIQKLAALKWSEVRCCGIPESQFYALKKQLKQGKVPKLSSKTARRLKKLMIK